ncbi:MAG: putative ABC transporter permease [Firmicutes bacterium]|nr:putative ABC transporter permease [Bacillota bacterium]
MENKKKNKFTFWDLVIFFTFYSVIGWCYEVFLEVVVYRWGFTNRGVLFGPYTPVYGFGALAFLLLVYPVIRNKKGGKKLAFIPVVFLLCMLIATAIELGTSYILEAVTGSWPWQTYADYAINFQARIALSPSIRFGLGGVLFLYVLQPIFEKICEKLGPKKTRTLAVVFLAVFAADCVYTFAIK